MKLALLLLIVSFSSLSIWGQHTYQLFVSADYHNYTGTFTASNPQEKQELNAINGKTSISTSATELVITIPNFDPVILHLNPANAGKTIDVSFLSKAKQLEEIIIVGNSSYYQKNPSATLRIATPILETAQNIQVVSKEVLNQQQATDMLEGVQRNVSGAQRVEHWDNYARINMRGSQLTAFRNGMNVQLSPWSPLSEDMSMVERIEFVKGPAGFMLGNGEPSGFYNVVTKKPTGIEKGEVSMGLGSYHFYRATADMDGKLSKNGKWLYRLNVMGQLKNSHRDFEFNNRYSLAPVIKYQISDQTSFTLEYNEQFVKSSTIGSNYAFSKRSYADLPINFSQLEANMAPTTMRDRSLLALFEHQINDNWKFTGQVAYLNYQQEGQSLWPWGISMYNDSLMQRGVSIWDALGENRNGQFFINGKFNTGSIRHTLLGGLDLSYRDYFADWSQGAALGDTTFNIYDPVYGTVSTSEMPQWDRSEDIRTRGVRYSNGYSSWYAQDELAFFENKLRLTLAGRYTSIDYINPYSGNYQASKFTPRAGLSWSIRKDFAAYAVYDQSFVANPGLDYQGNNFDPLNGENMEVGLKKDWFNGRFNTAVSTYQITKNNVLTTDVEHPDAVTGQFIYSKQTGQQQVQGIEVDVRGTILPGLDVVVNYAYTDARVTKDSDAALVGRKTAGATDHIQNTWFTYSVQKGTFKGLRANVGYQYQAGRSSWYIFDGSENSLPNYFRMDAGIGYSVKQFDVSIIVNNVLNEYLYSGAPYYGMFYWQTEAGRNYRCTIRYRF